MHSRPIPSVPAAEFRKVIGSVLPTALSSDTVFPTVLAAIGAALQHAASLIRLNPTSCALASERPGRSDASAVQSALVQDPRASVLETCSSGLQILAIVVMGCLPTANAQSLGTIDDGASATSGPRSSADVQCAECDDGTLTPTLQCPMPRRDNEPLTTYLLVLQQQHRDLVLSPSAWAALIGRSERELRRAARSGALVWRKKASGRDHASCVIGIGELITYASTVAAVWCGTVDAPDWWACVHPRVAA